MANEGSLLNKPPRTEIKLAIKYMGGYTKAARLINLHAFKKHHHVTKTRLRQWVADGEIEPAYGRVALVIESATGCRFRPEFLCPKIFEDWRTI